MASAIPPRDTPIDLSISDVLAIREHIQAHTGRWSTRTSRDPGPLSAMPGPRWLYTFWSGPPCDDIVPALAVARTATGYLILTLAPLEYFEMGYFSSLWRYDLPGTKAVIIQLIDHASDVALSKGLVKASRAVTARDGFEIH